MDFPPFLHNEKKIAFANYHSLKAIRVFGGDSGHEQKRQSERPTQNFSSIRFVPSKTGVGELGGRGCVKAAISSSRDGGDKIFTAFKGGALEGQRHPHTHTPTPHSGGRKREDKERETGKPPPHCSCTDGRLRQGGEKPPDALTLSPLPQQAAPTTTNHPPAIRDPPLQLSVLALLKIWRPSPLQAGIRGVHSQAPLQTHPQMLPMGHAALTAF